MLKRKNRRQWKVFQIIVLVIYKIRGKPLHFWFCQTIGKTLMFLFMEAKSMHRPTSSPTKFFKSLLPTCANAFLSHFQKSISLLSWRISERDIPSHANTSSNCSSLRLSEAIFIAFADSLLRKVAKIFLHVYKKKFSIILQSYSLDSFQLVTLLTWKSLWNSLHCFSKSPN